MFETLAPFIIAGLLVVTGYMFTRWLVNLGELRQWKGAAEISFRHNDELEEQIAGMRAEGCAAVGLVQNIFNGLTSPSAIGQGASLRIQQEMADACAKLLTEATRCGHEENAENWERLALSQHDELLAAMLNAENWQNIAVESEAWAEEAERLLGLVNDRLIVDRSQQECCDGEDDGLPFR